MNSWKSVSFPSIKEYTQPEYHLIMGGNVIAKTSFSNIKDNDFIEPLFFLNTFDMPFLDFAKFSVKIKEDKDETLLTESDLTFEPGHYLTKRNPDKEILVEFYDKSFPNQVHRNLLKFSKGQGALEFIPFIPSYMLIRKEYKKLLNNMKY